MPDTIGERIKKARETAGLSMRQLAAVALGGEGNARMIATWESGEFEPSLPSLRKIAPHLSLAVADLIPDSTSNILPAQEATPTQTPSAPAPAPAQEVQPA